MSGDRQARSATPFQSSGIDRPLVVRKRNRQEDSWALAPGVPVGGAVVPIRLSVLVAVSP